MTGLGRTKFSSNRPQTLTPKPGALTAFNWTEGMALPTLPNPKINAK